MTDISITNLHCAFGETDVLRGVNLSISQGQFVSIVGRSGCGKSTLLNCVAGFVKSSSGSVSGRARFGFVFQNHSLYPFMTCRENIALGLSHMNCKDAENRVNEYLEIVGLASHAERYPWQLSGGESQRISIARAFAPEPDAVLMDEPLSALDVMRRESMLEWLMEFLKNRSTTVVMVTHWIDEAIVPADRVIVLRDGIVSDEFKINLARPRSDQLKTAPEFVTLRTQIRNCIFQS